MKLIHTFSLLSLACVLASCTGQDPKTTPGSNDVNSVEISTTNETETPISSPPPTGTDFERKSFAKNVASLNSFKAHLEKYKSDNGSYPVAVSERIVSQSLTVLRDAYQVDLPKSAAGPRGSRFFYESDGTDYKMTMRFTGDCFLARQSPELMIDTRFSYGDYDCMSYGISTKADDSTPKFTAQPSPSTLAQNQLTLSTLKSELERYKNQYGSYPVSANPRSITGTLIDLKTAYGTELTRPAGHVDGRFLYVSNGADYKLLTWKSGDCYFARKSGDVKIDKNYAAGSVDCLAYGVWSAGGSDL